MGLRYVLAPCELHKRDTPHLGGRCALCLRKARLALRAVKRARLGVALPRFEELRKIADDLHSVWLRAAARGCRMCGAQLPPGELQWAHHRSRSLRGLRYHPDNESVLCAPCHMAHSHGQRRLEWEAWLRDVRLGPARYANLERMERARGRLNLSDVQLVILEARTGIAALPSGPRRAWALEREAVIVARLISAA